MVAVDEGTVVDMGVDGAGQHLAFDIAADRDIVVRRYCAWVMRAVSCSMIGPSSRSAVT